MGRGRVRAGSPEEAAFIAGRRLGVRAMAVVVAATAWFAVLLMGLGYAILLQLLGDAACELDPGGSNYGELGWSVVPPGPTCTFIQELHGIDEVRGPTPVMSVWLLVLVAGGVALVVAARRTARSWSSAWRTSDRSERDPTSSVAGR